MKTYKTNTIERLSRRCYLSDYGWTTCAICGSENVNAGYRFDLPAINDDMFLICDQCLSQARSRGYKISEPEVATRMSVVADKQTEVSA
jgi:hypothetical protein